jgi:hypothetical protein
MLRSLLVPEPLLSLIPQDPRPSHICRRARLVHIPISTMGASFRPRALNNYAWGGRSAASFPDPPDLCATIELEWEGGIPPGNGNGCMGLAIECAAIGYQRGHVPGKATIFAISSPVSHGQATAHTIAPPITRRKKKSPSYSAQTGACHVRHSLAVRAMYIHSPAVSSRLDRTPHSPVGPLGSRAFSPCHASKPSRTARALAGSPI